MLKTLVIKELRESAGLVVLAALASAYVLGGLTGNPLVPWQPSSLHAYPFVGTRHLFDFWMVGGGLAIALGLRQTAWELGHGNYLFLLHRPVDRGRIFGLKLLVGSSLSMLVAALLILIYAWWAATPGHFAAPFDWSMTTPAWINWISLPPVYVGAFLSGVRPGLWFGSRLAPMVAGGAMAYIASIMPWFWAALAISLIALGFGLVSIFYYVRYRDY